MVSKHIIAIREKYCLAGPGIFKNVLWNTPGCNLSCDRRNRYSQKFCFVLSHILCDWQKYGDGNSTLYENCSRHQLHAILLIRQRYSWSYSSVSVVLILLPHQQWWFVDWKNKWLVCISAMWFSIQITCHENFRNFCCENSMNRTSLTNYTVRSVKITRTFPLWLL